MIQSRKFVAAAILIGPGADRRRAAARALRTAPAPPRAGPTSTSPPSGSAAPSHASPRRSPSGCRRRRGSRREGRSRDRTPIAPPRPGRISTPRASRPPTAAGAACPHHHGRLPGRAEHHRSRAHSDSRGRAALEPPTCDGTAMNARRRTPDPPHAVRRPHLAPLRPALVRSAGAGRGVPAGSVAMRITYKVFLVGGIPITIAAAIALAAFVLLNEADRARSGAVLAGTIYRNLLSARASRDDFLERQRASAPATTSSSSPTRSRRGSI